MNVSKSLTMELLFLVGFYLGYALGVTFAFTAGSSFPDWVFYSFIGVSMFLVVLFFCIFNKRYNKLVLKHENFDNPVFREPGKFVKKGEEKKR